MSFLQLAAFKDALLTRRTIKVVGAVIVAAVTFILLVKPRLLAVSDVPARVDSKSEGSIVLTAPSVARDHYTWTEFESGEPNQENRIQVTFSIELTDALSPEYGSAVFSGAMVDAFTKQKLG